MRFLPREEKFFQYFIDQANLIDEGAKILLAGVQSGGDKLEQAADQVAAIEDKGDAVIHRVLEKLNDTFITPIDPEDIHSIASHMDDVLDYLEDAAHCLVAYKIRPVPNEVVEICSRILGCAEALKSAFHALNQDKPLISHCIEINRLEGEVDKIERRAVAELFNNETDAIRVMKLREVYDLLERTTDACEDVADLLQNVVVKNG
jgi:uncharacterized protein